MAKLHRHIARTHTHTSTSFLSVTKSNACNECGALSPRSYVLSVCLLGLVNPLPLLQLGCCVAFPSGRMPYVSKCTEIQNLIFLHSVRLLHLTPPRPTKSIWPWLIIVTKAVQENMHVLTVRQIRSQRGGGGTPRADPRLFSSDGWSLTQKELLKTGLWSKMWLMAHCYNTQDKERCPMEIRGSD